MKTFTYLFTKVSLEKLLPGSLLNTTSKYSNRTFQYNTFIRQKSESKHKGHKKKFVLRNRFTAAGYLIEVAFRPAT